jgi:selenocysteine lyase/cysteine desulfurase/dTDP-4-dehydrorhamnose reductase
MLSDLDEEYSQLLQQQAGTDSGTGTTGTGAITYFDSAGRSVLPHTVEAVGIRAMRQKACPWGGVGSDQDVEDVRTLFAELIHCQHPINCIAMCPSTGFAMTMAARNIVQMDVLRPGKTVLLMEKEMGSVVYPWQHACDTSGATLRFVGGEEAEAGTVAAAAEADWATKILNVLTADTAGGQVAVLALPMVHWCDGAMVDLRRIAAHIRSMPAALRPLLVVDATQSLGALDLDVMEIDPDFLACSVHKWLNAPYGMSLVYLSPRHHDSWVPLDQHERARAGSEIPAWDEAARLCAGYATDFFPSSARRLDSGGKPNPILVPMSKAALQLTLKWRPTRIQKYLSGLTGAILDGLVRNLGADLIVCKPKSQRCGHFMGIQFAPASIRGSDVEAVDLVALCSKMKTEHNVFTSVRGGYLRISPYIFNTSADVEKLVAVITQIVVDMYQQAFAAADIVKMLMCESGSNSISSVPLKVLVTGAAGWLGQLVCQSMLTRARTVELHAAYHAAVPDWIVPERRWQVDFADAHATRQCVQQVRPDVIVHLAAMASPFACHKDPSRACAVNCPSHFVDAVQEYVPDCLFVFASTDMVYDGRHPSYYVNNERKPPVPANVYGATKLRFEREACRLRRAVVLRLSNMVGAAFVYRNAGTKFLQFLDTSRRSGAVVGLKSDEVRSFVYVGDVVDIISAAILNAYPAAWGGSMQHEAAVASAAVDGGGVAAAKVFNIGGPQGLGRLELGEELCRATANDMAVYSSAELENLVEKYTFDAEQQHKACWKVHAQLSPPAPAADVVVPVPPEPPAVPAIVPAVPMFPELVSPKDISMDSSATEQHFGMRFTPLSTILAQAVAVDSDMVSDMA